MKETSGGKVKGNERKQLVTMMNNKRGRHIEHKIKIDRYERDEMNWPNSMLPVSVIPALSCAHSLSLSLLPGLCEFVRAFAYLCLLTSSSEI